MSETEQVQEESPMSFEDKFLGVKHQVVKSVQEKLEEQNQQKETNSDLEIEVVDDLAPEDRRAPRSQNTKDDDDEELANKN